MAQNNVFTTVNGILAGSDNIYLIKILIERYLEQNFINKIKFYNNTNFLGHK